MAERVYTQTFGAVCALIVRGNKVLLVKEAMGIDKGKWHHGGGILEVGENPIEGIIREINEETGYDFVPKNILGIYSLVRTDIVGKQDEFGIVKPTPHPVKIVYLGEISENPVRELADDITEIKWFSPEEIEAMGQDTLREIDTKQMVKDYFAGKKYPLELLTHTVQK